ncbi:magnesium transporter MgtE N-terminal domain-containing protein, partial [Oleiphilus sp. HI0125]
MASYSNNQTPEQHWRSISDAIEAGSLKQVARIINKSLSTSDVAHLIESSPPKQRNIIWQLVDDDYRGEVLQDLSEDVQAYFLSKLNAQELIDATEDLDTDDLAD